MRSRHLAALATGTCLGLTGIGQVAFADRGGDRDVESEAACSADYRDNSDNDMGAGTGGGLLGLGSIGLQNTLLGSLNNLLCGANILNDLDINILGSSDGDDDRGRGDSEVECSADYRDRSNNSIGDAEGDGGLLGVGLIGAQNTGKGILNNALCGPNIGNDIDINILGSSDGDDDRGRGDSDVECNANYDDDSENTMGESTGIGGLLGLGGIGLQNTLLGSLNNLGCGASILNDLNLNILGRL